MNAKILLVVSLALNVILGAYAWRKPVAPPPAPAAAAAPVPPAQKSAPKVQVVEQTVTNTVMKRFGWESVESADYKQYIANLRSVGCPEETIRDIIIADVNKLYDAKKKQVRGAGKKFEYWKSAFMFSGMMGDSETREKIRALDDEKNGVLRALGIEPDFKTAAAEMVNPLEAMFDFLPDQKKTQLLKLMTDMQTKMAKSMEGGGRPDPAEIAKAQKEMEQAVKQLLTPEEALNYDLRMSMTANMLRMQSAGFDPNEEEFLKVFKLRKSFDDEFSPMTRGDETDEQRKRREASEKQLKEQLKEALGTRYADYERAQDWSYQQIHGAAKKADLGTAAANQVYEMKKLAEQKATELRNNSKLSKDERSAALAAIQQETQKSIQQVLGEKGWEQYNRGYNTSWLKNMVPKPPKAAAKQ